MVIKLANTPKGEQITVQLVEKSMIDDDIMRLRFISPDDRIIFIECTPVEASGIKVGNLVNITI